MSDSHNNLQDGSTTPLEGIAIIGMSGKFPGAPTLEAFWSNLLAGRDSITRFTPPPDSPTDFVPARGVLEDAAMFDASYFAIPPREADLMDPQHRLFLEACSNALESSGYNSEEYPGEIGLFGGCSLNTYLLSNLGGDPEALPRLAENYQVGEFQVALGNDKDFLTTRVAYKLNLRGPVVTVQSACATSLVAICQASQALMNYTCDMALAGGVSVTFPQERGHVYQEGGIASIDGTCRPFDAAATGTVFSHGVGVIVLKRLDDAIRDGDTIAAVIRGFAVNNDGSQKAGYMAPGIDGQARVIAAAHAMAGISADTITYVEAHGTATPLGDPVEVAALTRAFRESTSGVGFCAIGTAKANVGHMDSAAGVAGVIKTVLSLQHQTIPALPHFQVPNLNIDFASTPFVPAGVTRAWKSEGPRRAGVSAFGVGGVNAHIVLEEAPSIAARPAEHGEQILCLSARTSCALEQARRELADHLEQHPLLALSDVAYTLAVGRRRFDQRFACTVQSSAEAIAVLRSEGKPVTGSRRQPAFLFSGQGSQFAGMGKALYDSEPVYRDVVDRCAEMGIVHLGLDIRQMLFGEPGSDAAHRLNETAYAQPALFITEYALAQLLAARGVKPAALLGHSVGEYAAATMAGIFQLEDALRLVCVRGRLMQALEAGAMTSVSLGEADLQQYVTKDVSIAALNSPRSSVLSGPLPAIEALEAQLLRDNAAFRRLRTSHAFHSRMMAPMLAEFSDAFKAVSFGRASIPFVSSVTGTWISTEEASEPSYWVDQCRQPVRFSAAVQTLIAAGYSLMVEVGPAEALTALTLQHREPAQSSAAELRVIPALPVPREGQPQHHAKQWLADLWAAGADVAMDPHAEERRMRVPLPTYPFERKLHWIAPPERQTQARSESATQLVADRNSATASRALAASSAGQPQPRLEKIEGEIAKILADLSGIETRREEYSLQFLELGFDSLFLTQATQSLSRHFNTKLTFRQLMEQHSSIHDLARHLDQSLPAEAFAAAPAKLPAAVNPSSAPAEQLLDAQITSLSELFAQQVAALRSVVTGNPPPSIPVTPQLSSGRDGAEVKHGSFRPIQPRVQHEVDAEQERYLRELIALYAARTPASKRATAAARAHLADPRAVAGFRPQWKEMVYPLVVDRAKGSRLWDLDGNEYVDIVNGYGCIMFGHSPDFVVKAAREQLDRGVAIGPQSALAGEVAKLICELTGNERATFCNTGSEAVMAAMRVARTVTGRDKIVYFSGDYHGTFDEVLVRSTPRGSSPVAPGIPVASTSNIVVLEYGTDESLAWIRANADDLAAVLIEPVQTRHPGLQPFDFIRAVREITADHGVAFILDEVVTGFRLAPGGVQQHLGIRADMCTYGKVIGGGHPIGVLSGKAMYLDALDGGSWQYGDDSAPEVGVTFFAGTFVRHPLALAAARAVLTHLKAAGPQLQNELNQRTAALAESLDRFMAERGLPTRVHHFTSWFYFTFPQDARLASLFYYSMRTKGIHIQEGYPCFMTTAHTDADFKRIEEAFRDTIIEMQEGHVLPSAGRPTSLPAGDGASGFKTARMHPDALENVPGLIAMTEPQREVYFAAAISDAANCAFNESLTLTLEGPVDREKLAFALDAAIARHDALRSTVSDDGESLRFAPAFTGQIEWVDLAGLTLNESTMQLQHRVAVEAGQPFDLHRGPLLHCVCFVLSDVKTSVVLTAHHIVLDGWSANQLLEEVGRIYSDGARALTELDPLLPFSSYAVREQRRQEEGAFSDNERFWIDRFAGRSPRLELPTDQPRGPVKTYNGDTFAGALDASLYEALKLLSRRNGCTLYVTLLSSFQLLMHRLTGQDEVVVGISTAGQSLNEGASLVGHCVNFLPMLSTLASEQTVEQHLRATRTALLDAQDHQEFTFGSLLGKLKLERDSARLPLIEVQFNLERVGSNVSFAGLQNQIKPNRKQYVNTDLFLNVVEDAEGLDFTCDYNTDLFTEHTIDRWMTLWATLLKEETIASARAVACIDILPAAEREFVLHDFNRTEVDFGPYESVPAMFLRVAAQHPDKCAILCGGKAWSYGDLAEYATILARRLIGEGLKPGSLAGICIERSPEMVGAMLAVMLAGGAYVPLDPRNPRERLATIMDDAGIQLLLTGRDPSVQTTARILNITGPQPASERPLPQQVPGDALAYVIYTSGTTGVPKGVAIEQNALRNLLLSMQREPGLTAGHTLVAITTLSFDIAALELLLPLITGAQLVIATSDQVTDGTALLRLMESTSDTVVQATPGAWRILIDAGWNAAYGPNPRPLKVLCGGEALPRDLADTLLDRSAEVWNMYGPTETTIWSAATRVTRGSARPGLGTPIANTQFYVLNDGQNPAPVGVVGELYIGGAGLARGYWRREDLTRDRFLPNPFAPGRIYRTGDLARRHLDGSLELLGRSDFQVKIRGYRIEPGDIEAVLRTVPQVREAVVIARQASDSAPARLIGFLETEVEGSDATGELISAGFAAMARSLPEYMVPGTLLTIRTIPRTANGKVDRKALPLLTAEDQLDVKSSHPFTEPENELESKLAGIWGEVLVMPSVSTSKSIFELGADSLLIFRIAARAQRDGLGLTAAQIFEHRNIRTIARALQSKTPAPAGGPQGIRIGAVSRENYRRARPGPKVNQDA